MIKDKTQLAFTLAELLIALAILGVIATFTIPKILDSGSDSKFNAITKEAISMVAGAYQTYKLNNTVTTATGWNELTPYMNYVKVDTTTTIDSYYSSGTASCGALNRSCLQLHNGAIFYYWPGGASGSFGDLSITTGISFYLDPDGKVTTTGAANTPGKSVEIYLYTNGRLTSRATIEPNTHRGTNGPYAPNPNFDPPWFSWSN